MRLKNKSIFSCKSLFSSLPEKKRGICGELEITFSLDLKIQIFVYFRVSVFSVGVYVGNYY